MEHEEYKSLDDKDTFNEKGCEYSRCTRAVQRYEAGAGKYSWQILRILSMVGYRLLKESGEI